MVCGVLRQALGVCLVVSLSAALPAIAEPAVHTSFQQVQPVDSDTVGNLDLSGVWITRASLDVPTDVPTNLQEAREQQCSGGSCPRQVRNWLGHYDSFQLQVQRAEIVPIGGTSEVDLYIDYTGVFTRWLPVGADPDGPGAPLQGCGAVALAEYDMTGTLVFPDRGGFAQGQARLQLTGTLDEGSVDAAVRDNVPSTMTLFDFVDPVGGDLDPAYGSDEPAVPCSISTDEFGTPFSTLEYGGHGGVFISTPQPLDLRGIVTGRVVEEGLGPALDRASVALTVPGDGEVIFAGRRAGGRTVAYTTLDSEGRFAFPNVPLLTTGPGGVLHPARYSVTASRGERDVSTSEFDSPVLYYADVTVDGVYPGRGDTTLEAQVEPELAIKRGLIDRLTALSPDNYGPVEQVVAAHLDAIEGEDPPQESDVEAVRRAIWAERFAAEVSSTSQDLTQRAADQLGTLVGNAFKDFVDFTRADIRAARSRSTAQLDAAANANINRLNLNAREASFYWNKHQNLTTLKLVSQVAQVLRGALNLASRELTARLRANGVDPGVAGDVGNIAKATLDAMLRYAQRQTIRGGLQGIAGSLIAVLVAFLGPVLYDGRVVAGPIEFDLPGRFGFTGLGRWTLHYSAERMQHHFVADADDYARDRQLTVDLLNDYGTDATNITVLMAYIDAFIETAAAGQEVADAAGVLIPQAQAAKRLSQLTKYATNIQNIVSPLMFVFGDSPDMLQRGVCQAWGDPTGATSLWSVESADEVCGESAWAAETNRTPAATPRAERAFAQAGGAGGAAFGELEAASGPFAATLSALSTALATDDLGGAVNLMSSDANDGYGATAGAVTAAANAFALVLGAAADAPRFGDAQLAVDTTAMDLVAGLDALVIGAMDVTFLGPGDPRYEALRDRTVAAADALADAVRDLVEVARTAQADDPGPVVAVSAASPVSAATGSTLVTQAGETFRMTARVHNLSASPVSGLSTRLTVEHDGDEIVADGETRDIGTLAADDGVPGSGDDEVVVEWSLVHSGERTADAVPLTVEVLESGATPTEFITNAATVVLFVGAELADVDLDALPDAWENAHGLDAGRDDAADDADGDGLSNASEYRRQLDPTAADSDGDGLGDGEETSGGADGWVTDPALADSDSDGTGDGADGAPLDFYTSAAQPPPAEPMIVVDPPVVTLTEEVPYAFVSVSNGGEGQLLWTAQAQTDVISVGADPAEPRPAGPFLIQVQPGHDFSAGPGETVVRVADASGATTDVQAVGVVVEGTGVLGSGGVNRLAGATRELTAVAISRSRFPRGESAGAVVLARRDDFADGLAGTPLAAAVGGPLLLTGTPFLDRDTRAEIQRVLRRGATVHLLGGTAAISDTVVSELEDLGYVVQRLAGESRFTTAVAVAQALGPVDTVLVARGDDFPDALAAGPAAILSRGAIVLSAGGAPHPDTDAYLAGLGPDVARVAVGGQAAAAYPDATAIAGAGREETAVAVAEAFFADVPLSVGIARRDAFADALSGGVHAGALLGPVLLTGMTELHPAVAAYLMAAGASLTDTFLYGGESALSGGVLTATAAATGLPAAAPG